ncbi:hypothetical protein IFM89_034410 [Coptis chinensis]|uniref:Uncharacterized protein n=1 Tax=Coptis chinensis TaxID=261450 RepID=A0A835IYK6_9MAGN|nr:hypothetical protein IFM89_034410 [Coptis chinensis]
MDYRTDSDNGGEGEGFLDLTAGKGGKFYQPMQGSAIAQPPLFNQSACSARPNGQQFGNAVPSPALSHGFGMSGGISDPKVLESEPRWDKTPGAVNTGETITIGGAKRKVMSAELAYQRELAYRKKKESLQKQTSNHFQEPSKNVQEREATCYNTVFGSKREAPSMKQTCLPPQQPRQFHNQQGAATRFNPAVGTKRGASAVNQSCLPPQQQKKSYTQQGVATNFNTVVGNNQEVASMKQSCFPPQQLRQYSNQQAPKSQQVIFFCNVCQVSCSGELCFSLHNQGKKHKSKLEELKNYKIGASMGTEPLMCKVCNIQCMNERNFREHLSGKKHATCLQAICEASKGVEDTRYEEERARASVPVDDAEKRTGASRGVEELADAALRPILSLNNTSYPALEIRELSSVFSLITRILFEVPVGESVALPKFAVNASILNAVLNFLILAYSKEGGTILVTISLSYMTIFVSTEGRKNS